MLISLRSKYLTSETSERTLPTSLCRHRSPLIEAPSCSVPQVAIKNFFELFKDKRKKGDQAATVIKIQNNYFRIGGTADDRLEQDILKLIREISDEDKGSK
jgi:hypothetical protein